MKKETEPTTEPTPPVPVSPLYYIHLPGAQTRLFSDGWHCTCGQPDCEHILVAKVRWEAGKEE